MLEFVRQATAEDALAGPRSLAEMHAAHVERRRREMALGMAAAAEKRRAVAKAKADAAVDVAAQLARARELTIQARMRGPRIQAILAATTEEFGYSALELISHRRFMPLVLARQSAIYVALLTTIWSLPQTGHYFGGRDHTTVMHARDKIAALIAADPEFAARVARIAASVRPTPVLDLEASA